MSLPLLQLQDQQIKPKKRCQHNQLRGEGKGHRPLFTSLNQKHENHIHFRDFLAKTIAVPIFRAEPLSQASGFATAFRPKDSFLVRGPLCGTHTLKNSVKTNSENFENF